MTDLATMWWCPTCQRRIPQPRWMNMGKPNQGSYHWTASLDGTLTGRRMHTIERVPVLDGEVIEQD